MVFAIVVLVVGEAKLFSLFGGKGLEKQSRKSPLNNKKAVFLRHNSSTAARTPIRSNLGARVKSIGPCGLPPNQ